MQVPLTSPISNPKPKKVQVEQAWGGIFGGFDVELDSEDRSLEPNAAQNFPVRGSLSFNGLIGGIIQEQAVFTSKAATKGLMDLGGSTISAGLDLWKQYIRAQESDNKPKTPADQQKEQKAADTRWTIEQQAQTAQEVTRVAQRRDAQDQATAGVAGMSTEIKNQKLGLQSGYENISNPYHMARIREQLMAELKASQEAKKSQETVSAGGKKGGFVMREGELQMGGENRQHFTNVAG